MAGPRRSRRRPPHRRHARLQRGHLQPPRPSSCPASPTATTRSRSACTGRRCRASSFMEVGIDDGKVKRGAGDVERSCYCIHAPIHKALPQAKAVFHTHMPYASALTRLEDPRIKEIGQTEVGMMGKIAYDDNYTGPAFEPEEGERLAKVIGDKTVLFMANHGISTVGNIRGRGLRPPLLHRARRPGADLRHVDRPAPQAAARAGGGEDQEQHRRRAATTKASRPPSATSTPSSASSTARSPITWGDARGVGSCGIRHPPSSSFPPSEALSGNPDTRATVEFASVSRCALAGMTKQPSSRQTPTMVAAWCQTRRSDFCLSSRACPRDRSIGLLHRY